MSIAKVKKFFDKYGMADKIREFDVSSATVELAAKALGCEECRIAKTMSFNLKGKIILVVTAGDARIDNKKYKARFGGKAKMLSREETEPLTGHKAGGVCPFAVNEGVETYIDLSVKRFETVFPAAGSANSAIELTPDELYKYSDAKDWVDVCKIPK